MNTTMAKAETVQRGWWVIDAADQRVGRLAVIVANILRGKHKPEYTPHCDTGDFVVIINAEKITFTGNKMDTKEYQNYTHYASGLRRVIARDLLARQPEKIIREAIRRMVPRNPLGRRQMSKLNVYAGDKHPHQAQQPKPFVVQA
ncbi:MAG: 50S ribosomal protein L13 [Planctomycetes bacterium]|jgi:large subunit ribosomal protein L13|nr:50S ribosomal protein L13 [Planctomycetota bacterium]